MNDWWDLLPEETRGAVDAHVLRDRRMAAVRAAFEALRPLDLGIHDAVRLVHDRYQALGDRVRNTPPDPLDVDSLAARAAGHPGRVAAIEAVWDGDTFRDWFVVLLAVLDGPAGDGHLATVLWLRGGPEPSTAATEAGRALAERLGVPFHFASPDAPDDQAPRWRETRGGA
ncbi:hypothetical protein NX794_31330 [Streptomyces sp. LP11]|uniref:Uncharacterized protein n=1 Tax=Streptomyces pyxinicus TaxID=2970331 RepID=A0ABT2BAY5_9ACTN|nr:hypothetical protein [Streptomyces sp. LP11]MCS0605662.1 hypothetical protein [Streptomyces sp. LP11]